MAQALEAANVSFLNYQHMQTWAHHTRILELLILLTKLAASSCPSTAPRGAAASLSQCMGGGAWVGILLGVATLLCTGGCGPGCSSRVPDIALGVSGFFHLYIRDVVETKPCKVAELRSVLALHIGPSQGGPTLHLRTSHVTTRRRTHFVGKAAPLRECSKRDSGRWQGGCTVPAA